MKKTVLTFLTIVFTLVSVSAQTDDLIEMSFEDLMNMDVTVASKKAMSLRESPGIISVLTAEEILTSGARDLIDVLRLVPGVDFGVDVQGVVGLSIRGNWAHDGKVLMMIDGLEVNEMAFSTLQFGNHYQSRAVSIFLLPLPD